MRRAPLQTTEVETVRPSTRDPIAQWLDVFTSLLALPAGEADRIRDELEDHLRTRVDDLLILGMTEPEAIQKAVTELGETAQLARNFRSVRTHSRRRIAMHTALFAAVGLAISVSVAGFLPGTPGALPGPVAVVQPEETGLKSLGEDLNGGTLEETLNIIAEATGSKMFVHWNTLEGFSSLARDSEIGPIPAKDLDGAKILELMNSMLNLSGAEALAVRHEGDLVEVANVAYFDRIETVTVDYDVSLLVRAGHVLMVTDQGLNLVNNIEKIVEPTVWQNNGGEASLTMSGSLLTVRAPKRIQEMVGQYIAKLEEIERVRAEQDAEDSELSRKEFFEMQTRAIAAIERTLATNEELLASQMKELDTVNHEYWIHKYRQDQLHAERLQGIGAESREGLIDQLAEAGAKLDAYELRREILRNSVAETRKEVEIARNQIAHNRSALEAQESAAR